MNFRPHSIIILFCLFTHLSAEDFEVNFSKQTSAFLNSLNSEQREKCILDNDDPLRWKMQYTGGKRAGIALKDLNQEQRAQFEKTIKLVLSEYGWQMANKVAKQDGDTGLDKYYVACFGDPRKNESFAFRLAEHHLTIVNFTVRDGKLNEFGPILLGANPPNLWDNEENALLKLWQTINSSKALTKGEKAIASREMKPTSGIPVSMLDANGLIAITEVWKQRISIFTPEIQEKIEKLHTQRGGIKKSRFAFYNEIPTKRCIDGGQWDFKCGLPGMVWDYEGSRGHLHFSLWIKPQ